LNAPLSSVVKSLEIDNNINIKKNSDVMMRFKTVESQGSITDHNQAKSLELIKKKTAGISRAESAL